MKYQVIDSDGQVVGCATTFFGGLIMALHLWRWNGLVCRVQRRRQDEEESVDG